MLKIKENCSIYVERVLYQKVALQFHFKRLKLTNSIDIV